jgi:malate dehydrogenase
VSKKVTVIGAGTVGCMTGQHLAMKGICDVVLISRREGIPQGLALDVAEAAPIEKRDIRIIGSNDYEASEGSDIIIISAGVARTPDMSRDDLLNTNVRIVQKVTEKAVKLSPDAIIIVISNPLDALCHVALDTSGFPPHRVMGMAGILDSARFRTFISWELGVPVENIQAMVLGGHGDTMVPLPRYTTIAGIPITDMLPPERVDALIERTRNGGAEIVSLFKTGSAFYAPSSAAIEMAEAIILDKKKILPCSSYLQGEYGYNDLFLGVPVKIGAGGVEEIIQIKMTDEEKAALDHSANGVRELVEAIKKLK